MIPFNIMELEWWLSLVSTPLTLDVLGTLQRKSQTSPTFDLQSTKAYIYNIIWQGTNDSKIITNYHIWDGLEWL